MPPSLPRIVVANTCNSLTLPSRAVRMCVSVRNAGKIKKAANWCVAFAQKTTSYEERGRPCFHRWLRRQRRVLVVEGGARAITMVFAATRLLCPSAAKSKAPVGVGVHVVAHAA